MALNAATISSTHLTFGPFAANGSSVRRTDGAVLTPRSRSRISFSVSSPTTREAQIAAKTSVDTAMDFILNPPCHRDKTFHRRFQEFYGSFWRYCTSPHRHHLDLDVELHRPARHRYEGARRRVDGEVPGIDAVDGV